MRTQLTLSGVLLISACTVGYKIDNQNVYWETWDEGRGNTSTGITVANPATFLILKHFAYAKDDTHAFYQGLLVEGADPDTFRSISDFHAVDSKHAFYTDAMIAGAKGSSFKVVDGNWARDNSDFFYQASALNVCDLQTFEIHGGYLDSWASDSKCAYFGRKKIPLADRASFIVLDGGYAKDKYNVYHTDKILEGADAQTFVMLKGLYVGKDKHGCYSLKNKIKCPNGH